MAKRTPYSLHDDYKKLPSFTFRFNGFLVWLINAFLQWDRFRRRRATDPGVDRSEEQIRNPDGSSLRVIVMRPKDLREPVPALIYYHGGAFALTYASLHLQLCERYAREAGCCVVIVDYRLGPSNPYPYGFIDCYRALEWTLQRAAELCVDPQRIAVMGDSSGGAMAAGVAQKARDNGIRLCGQLLIYPVLDSDCKTESAEGFSDVPIWNSGSNRNMWDMYLKLVNRQTPPDYASPAHREDLSGLAAAYVEAAEFDPLRDEDIDYARRLERHGVQVQLNSTSGTIHGYEMAPENPETIRSLKLRVDSLREMFGDRARDQLDETA